MKKIIPKYIKKQCKIINFNKDTLTIEISNPIWKIYLIKKKKKNNFKNKKKY